MPDQPKVSEEEQKQAEANHQKVADFLKKEGLEVKAALNVTRDGIFPQPYVVVAEQTKEQDKASKNPTTGTGSDNKPVPPKAE